MEEFYVPTGAGEAEFVEKRSRFIGRIFLCEDEAHALAELERIRKQHWDATHNVYAYIIHDGPTRYSDDGEPGGTAGMPVLEVLRREKLENVLCVVTRYFGVPEGADRGRPPPPDGSFLRHARARARPGGIPRRAAGKIIFCEKQDFSIYLRIE